MRFTFGVGLALVIGAGGVAAQVGPSADNGRALAEKLCVSCHVVTEGGMSGTVNADVPSFIVIANKPGQTAANIAGRIVLPHPPMPQMHLSRTDIADLATYIDSLKAP